MPRGKKKVEEPIVEPVVKLARERKVVIKKPRPSEIKQELVEPQSEINEEIKIEPEGKKTRKAKTIKEIGKEPETASRDDEGIKVVLPRRTVATKRTKKDGQISYKISKPILDENITTPEPSSKKTRTKKVVEPKPKIEVPAKTNTRKQVIKKPKPTIVKAEKPAPVKKLTPKQIEKQIEREKEDTSVPQVIPKKTGSIMVESTTPRRSDDKYLSLKENALMEERRLMAEKVHKNEVVFSHYAIDNELGVHYYRILTKKLIMNYLELAVDQFYQLKEDTLDDDRHSVGAECTEDYDIDGIKFQINVDGFWEKSTWFNWKVIDEKGNVIESGTNY